MEEAKDSRFDEGLDNEVMGYNGRVYTLYELRNSANNYKISDKDIYRRIVKSKYAKVYNCTEHEIPLSVLKEVYGLDINFKEIWKPVPGYKKQDYWVSNLGRIRHFGTIMLQDDKDLNGYLCIKGYEDSEKTNSFNSTTPIYDFIAYAFLGKIQNDGKHVHHINNHGYDCRPDNLILLTEDEHSKAHGFPCGKTSHLV